MAPIVPTMKYEKSLLEVSLPLDMYLLKSGILLALDSPLKGLVYEAAPGAGASAWRTAVELSARTAGLATAAERTHRREAVARGAIVNNGEGEERETRGRLWLVLRSFRPFAWLDRLWAKLGAMNCRKFWWWPEAATVQCAA